MAAGADAAPAVAEPEIPNGPAPPAPTDNAADRFYDPAAMAAARAGLRQEHGGMSTSTVMVNLAEYQARTRGGAGYRWEGQAWFGGDIDRFVVKSEGEGSRRGGLDSAEVQGLYSHAIGPYFNVEGGLRQDFKPRSRTYATVGVEGLAPYWFDVGGALFLSNKGELLGRIGATYDLRFSQRLILQPRVELNLAAQDTRETRTGAGLSTAELGLRLRYEITREFAPYIGVSYDRKAGKTASYARALGENPETTSLVVGVRAWF
ncbi:copper resistance protein B [Phenylobacterium sp.]|uniref:copper resistance protein B n=1 Tax=Phenylobacterium sp. TaxID=1871053 RepID=UPI00286D69AB|nr:copper resistance protein B [Phenylobacterium sp.]